MHCSLCAFSTVDFRAGRGGVCALRPGVPLSGRASRHLRLSHSWELGPGCVRKGAPGTLGSRVASAAIVIFPRVFLTSDRWSPSPFRKASAGECGGRWTEGPGTRARRAGRAKYAPRAMRSLPYAQHGTRILLTSWPSPTAVVHWCVCVALAERRARLRYGRLWEFATDAESEQRLIVAGECVASGTFAERPHRFRPALIAASSDLNARHSICARGGTTSIHPCDVRGTADVRIGGGVPFARWPCDNSPAHSARSYSCARALCERE
ncbi:hypothetical protein GY45DRAFT_497094 [Cubamyces sp. BRFM 1775]|nr:hypothetical protein GY45DRAFT_497094 [Cubamyces sp. BRFM 1775]